MKRARISLKCPKDSCDGEMHCIGTSFNANFGVQYVHNCNKCHLKSYGGSAAYPYFYYTKILKAKNGQK